MQFSLALPTFSEISDKNESKKIKTYLALLNDQLKYMFSNLEDDNLSKELGEEITTAYNNADYSKKSVISINDYISTAIQGPDGLNMKVELLDRSYSSLSLAESEIQAKVSNLEGSYSVLSHTSDKINWFVNGSSPSDFSITPNGISAISSAINLSGYVTFSSLSSSGSTSINGANIVSGSITAEKLQISDLSALNAEIAGWNLYEGLIFSHASNGSFYICSAEDTSGYWLRAVNSYGNTTFAVMKNGSGYVSGNFIADNSISCSKLVSSNDSRLDLKNNGNGINIGGSLHFNTTNASRKLYMSNNNRLIFDAAAGYNAWSLGLTDNGSSAYFTVFNGLGNTVGTINISK